MPLTKQQHLDPSHAPKRMLSLDGGGIRGVLTLEYLEVIETLLRTRYDDQSFSLCDYFDLIGGTSTGSILAAGLACGMSVGNLKALYRKLGSSVFQPSLLTRALPRMLRGMLVPKFRSGSLQRELDNQLGAETTLDSDKIRTGLMIMTKRLDTGGVWPVHNGRRGAYAAQDGTFFLTEIVRASTAAPTYFEPETIAVKSRNGNTVEGAFVDGGVTPFNDPTLQLLMLAALQGHGFCWPTGKDRLLLFSVGTGRYQQFHPAPELISASAAEQGIIALQSLMDDCERMNRAMLQWLTNCLTPSIIDRAVGDMRLDSEKGPQLATYVRYNVALEQWWLKSELGVDLAPDKIEQIRKMDDPTNMTDLENLGRLAAAKQVKAEHLPAAFDLA